MRYFTPSKPYKSAPVGRVGYKFANCQIALPIGSMYGIFTYIVVDFYGFHVGESTSPMDPMGKKHRGFFLVFGDLFKEYNDVDVAVHQPSYDTLGSPGW